MLFRTLISMAIFGLILLGSSSRMPCSPKTISVGVYVYIEETGAPVEGVYIFDNATNNLLGRTGSNGQATVSVEYGAKVRLVEPNYGQQQYVSNEITTSVEPIIAGWKIHYD